jgi:hypothetical protein
MGGDMPDLAKDVIEQFMQVAVQYARHYAPYRLRVCRPHRLMYWFGSKALPVRSFWVGGPEAEKKYQRKKSKNIKRFAENITVFDLYINNAKR